MASKYITIRDVTDRLNSNKVDILKGTVVTGLIIPFMKTFGIPEMGFEWKGVWINQRDLAPYKDTSVKSTVLQQPGQPPGGAFDQAPGTTPVQTALPGGEVVQTTIPTNIKTAAPDTVQTMAPGGPQNTQSLSFFSTHKKEIMIGTGALLLLLLLTSNDN